MPLPMVIPLFLIHIAVLVHGQQPESTSQCQGPPNVYCNCGSASPEMNESGQGSNLAQGRPGRIGPIGPVGSKGQKGERGQSEDTVAIINRLEARIVEQDMELRALKSLAYDHPSSCADVRAGVSRSSGYYLILPDRRQPPFRVFCNFTQSGAETIFNHDNPAETQRENCEANRCAKHRIVYYVPMQQIVAVINQSTECHQFIKYRCIGSVLVYEVANPRSAWLSRDGMPQNYWGGATSQRDGYCACGETNSCANNGYNCNCDANDNIMRFDEGFLTDKDKLPVTELQFGDAGDASEKGWFTLGPLICSGQSG